MIKFLKNTSYVFLIIIGLGVAFLVVDANSNKLAIDTAFLECTLQEINSDKWNENEEVIVAMKTITPLKVMGRLRNDWIDDKVLLNWVADAGMAEDGLETTRTLNKTIHNYTGLSFDGIVQRTFDRDSLIYTKEIMDTSFNEVEVREIRKCAIIDKSVFEAERKKSAAVTKAKQKI
jgi:hypothetical protein|tara:strand:+ start:174 stop:701 length:528 start_codon:yes stop_codon:yes gene_type:complete